MPDAAVTAPASRLLSALYDAAVPVVVWTALVPWTLLNIARGRATWADLREWLGGFPRGGIAPAPAHTPRIVVHAVSAGEATAAVALIQALLRAEPSWTVVMTVGNRDGRDMARAAAADLRGITHVVRLPWDRRRILARWLRDWQAAAVVVVEPEYWPALYRACGGHGVPLLLVNARVYPRDVPRYRLVRGLMQATLRHARWIGAPSPEERDRLAAIGAPTDRIHVVGNLKFDRSAPAVADRTAQDVARHPEASALTIVAGSTHPEDEAPLLDAYTALRRRFPALRLILAPRHVQRAADVVGEVQARGFRARIAGTGGAPDAAWDVLVLDRIGELAAVYQRADIAFVGGTLGDRGGHNVAEPARAGRAIVVGPSIAHVGDMVASLTTVDAIVRLPDARAATLIETFERLLTDPAARLDMGRRARAWHEQQGGAARRCADAIIAAVETTSSGRTISARGRRPDEEATWPLGASAAK
jgi:3-deoxy-D-manno-octulosonic-acid transferase